MNISLGIAALWEWTDELIHPGTVMDAEACFMDSGVFDL